MYERRTCTRHPVSIMLSISDLFKQEHEGIHDLDTPIMLEDVSHSGLCFISECILPVDYYFNAKVTLEGSDVPPVFTTVRIVRTEIIDRTHYRYGCEFTNLSRELAQTIDDYFLS